MNKLAWKKRKLEEKGEMGVGTLLIFIAMILVAAVAAGVLIQTAYKLQSQAEATGEQALQEVASGLKVITSWGVYDDASGTITDLYIKVALQAGSPQLNLVNLTIELTDGAQELSFNHFDAGNAINPVVFNTTSVRDTYPFNTWSTDVVGITAGDLVLIHIDLDANSMPLVTQQGVDVLLIPKHGTPTYFSFTCPSVFSTDIITLK
ncbi:MAG: flagellin [Thermoplasmata archaeon]|nr:flagellin [Thermoplasmata archaeon]